MKLKLTLGLAAFMALLAAAPSPLLAQEATYDAAGGNSPIGTTVTNATGTISQLNYSSNGTVEGFLLSGSTILLEFPNNVTGGINTLGAVGNSVTYSGTAVTSSTGFQTVRVTSFTNNTTKATFTATTGNGPAVAGTAYGPTSGTVRQLNYDDNGSIDGFLFAPAGSTALIFVSTGGQASATLKPLLTVGATVSVTGTSHAASTTTTIPTLTVVNPSSITIGGQTIVLATGGSNGRGPGGPGGRR